MLVYSGIKAFAGNPDDCYIKTSESTYVGDDIKIGLTLTKIFFADGTYREFKNRDIIAYTNHEKLYMMMPVVCNYVIIQIHSA